MNREQFYALQRQLHIAMDGDIKARVAPLLAKRDAEDKKLSAASAPFNKKLNDLEKKMSKLRQQKMDVSKAQQLDAGVLAAQAARGAASTALQTEERRLQMQANEIMQRFQDEAVLTKVIDLPKFLARFSAAVKAIK